MDGDPAPARRPAGGASVGPAEEGGRQRKQHRAYQRLRNFACVCLPHRAKLLVYLMADPVDVDLVPGFPRDMAGSVIMGRVTWRYSSVR